MPRREDHRARYRLAQECARIMVEEGLQDFLAVKRKAAIRLGLTDRALFPSNVEIQQALTDYQRLFRADKQPMWLQTLRQTALEAMRFLTRFQPHLVGSVLLGTADQGTAIQLHLLTNTAEEVMLFLIDHRIPFETGEQRLRLSQGAWVALPRFTFHADGITIELIVFSQRWMREIPLCPVDGRPMKRAAAAQVQALLAASSAQPACRGASY